MSKVLSFIKKYWGFLVLFVTFLIGFFVFRKQKSSFAEKISQINKRHEEEIEKINQIRKEEQRQKLESQKKYEQTLLELEKKYQSQLKELDGKKKKRIKEIIDNHGNDPEELSILLSKATGIEIIFHENGEIIRGK